MKTFFLENLDVICLFYGAAFFFLGAACLILYVREKEQFPAWLSLALFGFLHGCGEWLDMTAVSLSRPYFFQYGRSAAAAISFLLLLEFVRRSLVCLKKINLAALYLLPCCALAVFLVHPGCLPCFNALVRHLVGLPAALGAAYVFFLLGKNAETRKGSALLFSGLAFLFILYALAAGLVTPPSHLPTSALIGYPRFFEQTGIPVQFLRAGLATLTALCLFYNATNVVMREEGAILRRGRLNARLIIGSFLAFYGASLWVGFYLPQTAGIHERRLLEKIVIADAQLLRSALGRVDFEAFETARGGSIYPKYLAMHERMAELSGIATFLKALYLVPLRDGQPFFAVGSRTQVFPRDYVPAFGADIPQKIMFDALHSKKATLYSRAAISGDKVKTSLSVFLPLLNERGEARSLLGMDLDAARIQRQISKVRLFTLFVVGAFLLLLIAGYASLVLFALKNAELEMQKSHLKKALSTLREAEAELAKSEETFRGILNNSPNAIFGFDRDLRLIFWNAGAERIYGYRRAEVIDDKNPLLSKKMGDILGGAATAVLEEVFAGITRQEEGRQKTKDAAFDAAMTLFPVQDKHGRILFGMGIVQDISRCRQT